MRRFLLPTSAALLSVIVISAFLPAEDAPRAPRSARRAARRAARQAEAVASNQRGVTGGLNSAGRHALPTPQPATHELVFDESEMTVVTSNQFLPLSFRNLTDNYRLQQFLPLSQSNWLVVPSGIDQRQAPEPSPSMGYWLSPTPKELNWSFVPVEISQGQLPEFPARTSFAPYRYVVKLRNDAFPATSEPDPIAVSGNIIQSEEFLPPSPQRNSADPSTRSLQLGMKPDVAADAPACRRIVPDGSPAGDVLSQVVVAGELAGLVLPEPGRLDPSILQTSFNQLPVAVSGAIVFADETPPPLPPRENSTTSERVTYDVWDDVGTRCLSKIDKTRPTGVSAEEARVWAALDQPVSLHFEQARLDELFRYIANSQGINIVVDDTGLAEAGMTTKEPVSIYVDGVTLSFALNLILDARDLGWLVQDEVLKITSRQRSEGELFTRVYSVSDLIRSISQDRGSATSATRDDADFDHVATLIRTFVEPDSWNESGGPAALVPHAGSRSLVIRQTRRGHLEIGDLLGCVRQITSDIESLGTGGESSSPESGIRQTSYQTSGEPVSKVAERNVAAAVLTIHPQTATALTQPCSVHFDEAPLRDVLGHLADQYGLSFHVDIPGLANEGATPETPVTVNVDGIRITSTLNLILMPLNLRFEYQDGIVAITCRDRQKAGLTNRVYPVADLMRPGIRSLQQDPEAQGIDQPVPAQALIDLITCTLDPAGWSEFGGQGRITYEEPTLSLVVIQTPRIHQEIADLLEQLRQLRDVEIELELSSVKISRDDFARIKSEWGADWYGNRVDAAPEQIERLTSLLAGVETMPIAGPARITLYECQTWRVLATRAGDSPYAYVRAIPSPDRRRVDCRIAVPRITDGKQMLQDVSASTTTVGHTRVLNASEPSPVIEDRNYTGIARFGDVRELAPGEGDGIVWDESSDGVTLVFITPRIIVREEEEERLAPQPRVSESKPAGEHQPPAVITVTPRIIIRQEEEELLGIPTGASLDDTPPADMGPQPLGSPDILHDSLELFGIPTLDLLFHEEEPEQRLILQNP